MTDSIELPAGHRVTRTYWASTGHYTFTEHATQEDAEAAARALPTSVETLSYAERDAGVLPAGTGWVELRAVVDSPEGSTDAPLVRYAVQVERRTQVQQ